MRIKLDEEQPKRKKRNKFGAKKRKINGVTFDSIAESQYYLILLDKKKKGEIKDFELQPKFVLMAGFKKNGITHRPITYKADFKVINLDNSVDFIDVKGVETEVFKIKRKLFEKNYPDLSLTIIKGDAINGQTKPKKETQQRNARKAESRAGRDIRGRI